MKLQFHPFSEIYPLPPSHDIDAMADDIKKNGQRIPIVLYGGKILDGRTRYLACERAGLEPKVMQLGKGDPRKFVDSTNYFRRHLDTATRAKVAALMSIKSEVGKPVIGSNAPITQVEAAKVMGVSRESVKRAKAKITKKHEQKTKISGQSDNGGFSDTRGIPIPSSAQVYWRRKSEAEAILAKIRAAKKAVKECLPDDPMYAEVNLNGALADLGNAANRFSAAIPAHVCPYCKGEKTEGCKCCKSRGVISEFMWKTAVPEEMKPEGTNPF